MGCRHVAAAGSPTKQRALRDDGGGNLHFGTGIIGFLYLHNLIGQNAFHSLFSSPPLTVFFFVGGLQNEESKVDQEKILTER